ncbi:MAG: transcription elongation factor GreAB, partial [Byssovorax sp.]
MDKRALIQELIAVARSEMAVLDRAARAAREAATHEESRPENDKDTRAIEASYLAGAQADRIRDIERVINGLEFLPLRPFAATDPIASAALVEVDV